MGNKNYADINSLNKKVKKHKITSTLLGVLAYGGIALALGSGIYWNSLQHNPPENYKEMKNLEKRVIKINNTKENITSIDSMYTPSVKEIKEKYNEQKHLYNEAIKETKENISELKQTSEVKEYDRKNRNAGRGMAGGLVLAGIGGCFAYTEEQKRRDLKEKRDELEMKKQRPPY